MRPRIGSTRKAAVLAAAVLATCFLAGLAVAPVLEARGIASAQLLRDVYGSVCHRLPARSLWFGDRPLAVCARCTGLYLGGASGLFLAWLFPALGSLAGWRALATAICPTILDASALVLGGAGVPNTSRLLLAVPAGFVVGLLLSEGIADLAASGAARRLETESRGPVSGRP